MSSWDPDAGYDITDPKHPDNARASEGLADAVVRRPYKLRWTWDCRCGQINSVSVSICGRCGEPRG